MIDASATRLGFLRWSKVVLGIAVALTVLTVGAGLWLHEPRPSGNAGADADAVAQRLTSAVDTDAWGKTGYVRWAFAGRNEHQWDRERGLVRVRWDATEAQFPVNGAGGLALKGGQAVSADDAAAILKSARSRWVNDAFWLNPVATFFDPGVRRQLVPIEGEQPGLLVQYATGGETPGDAYLWILGADDRPRAWRMWVSILPIGGLTASWEGWQQLSTGAWVATEHQVGPLTLVLTQVQGATHWSELEADDPFLPLLARPDALR
jgi:hypothetical protein